MPWHSSGTKHALSDAPGASGALPFQEHLPSLLYSPHARWTAPLPIRCSQQPQHCPERAAGDTRPSPYQLNIPSPCHTTASRTTPGHNQATHW
jgi:hypothetical protein